MVLPGIRVGSSAPSATACSASPTRSCRSSGSSAPRWFGSTSTGRARAGPVRLRRRRRVPGAARRLRGGLGHGLLQLALGDPAADRLPAALTGQRPRGLPRLRGPAGAPLRPAGAVLAVRQRAKQPGVDLGRHRGRVRLPAPGVPPGGQGRRSRRGGGARRCPYGLPAGAPDSPERRFFDRLLRDGRAAFDLFDLHLYGPAERSGRVR
jgi:hypothetical protein